MTVPPAPIAAGTAGYPWGLLVVSDEGSDFQGFPAEFTWQPCIAGGDAVVFRVTNLQVDDVTVRLWRGRPGPGHAAVLVGSTPIAVPSGRLVVGDVVRDPEITMVVEVAPGSHVIDAYFDDPEEPTSVDLVIRPA